MDLKGSVISLGKENLFKRKYYS